MTYELTFVKDAPSPECLYTCIGKGGEYELLGEAQDAGECRSEMRMIYRDTATGQLFHRWPSDFRNRMEKIN